MNTKQYAHVKFPRLRDGHEPALSRSTLMKYTKHIDTKRIRDSYIGKCPMALIEQEFQTYPGKSIRLRLTGLLSPIRLYLARLRSSSNNERNVWPYPVSRPGCSENSLAPPRHANPGGLTVRGRKTTRKIMTHPHRVRLFDLGGYGNTILTRENFDGPRARDKPYLSG